jgi:hypothetical protein
MSNLMDPKKMRKAARAAAFLRQEPGLNPEMNDVIGSGHLCSRAATTNLTEPKHSFHRAP